MKKDNKGFSLVELIVVVLIMGILAVALTPQVMKWVQRSRVSADVNTREAVIEAVNLAITKKDVANVTGSPVFKAEVTSSGFKLYDGSTELSSSSTGADKAFYDAFYEYSGAKDTNSFKTKSGATITITATKSTNGFKVEDASATKLDTSFTNE